MYFQILHFSLTTLCIETQCIVRNCREDQVGHGDTATIHKDLNGTLKIIYLFAAKVGNQQVIGYKGCYIP